MSEKCLYKRAQDDDDLDTLSTVCFQINPGVQLREVPTNGEEYLLKVIKERQNYSTVTKCNKDYSKFAKNQSCFVKEVSLVSAADVMYMSCDYLSVLLLVVLSGSHCIRRICIEMMA